MPVTKETHPNADEVYTVPDESSTSEKCPTLPPRNAPIPSPSPDTKSATLLSVESNIYEDIDSDTDDGRSSVSATPDVFDIYSDTLDETLESDVAHRGIVLLLFSHSFQHLHLTTVSLSHSPMLYVCVITLHTLCSFC